MRRDNHFLPNTWVIVLAGVAHIVDGERTKAIHVFGRALMQAAKCFVTGEALLRKFSGWSAPSARVDAATGLHENECSGVTAVAAVRGIVLLVSGLGVVENDSCL